MKALMMSALLALTASSAHAAPLSCTTNVENNPRLGETSVVINGGKGVTTATERTSGGMAHFVTAPKTFQVSVVHEGPEVVVYSNKEEGFELEVTFQPVGGKIRGTLITEVFGQRIDVPVACVMAMDLE